MPASLTVTVTGVDSREVLTRTAARPEVVARYADHRDGLVDLHLPPGPGPHPLVVLVHGGFWKQEYDRRHTRPMSRALVAAGYVVAVPEYRRVGAGGGGGWPTTAEDLARAIDALAGLLDGLGIRTSSTVLTGHSAGGHLALWLAARDTRFDRVVVLAPVADLRAADRDGLGGGAARAFLGGGPDEVPDRYDAADPIGLLGDSGVAAGGSGAEAGEAAGGEHRARLDRIVVVHGTDDDAVPLTQSRALVAAHPDITLRVLEGAGHYDVIDPDSEAWPTVLDALGGRQGSP
jgi:acetyl esterase/lipase